VEPEPGASTRARVHAAPDPGRVATTATGPSARGEVFVPPAGERINPDPHPESVRGRRRATAEGPSSTRAAHGRRQQGRKTDRHCRSCLGRLSVRAQSDEENSSSRPAGRPAAPVAPDPPSAPRRGTALPSTSSTSAVPVHDRPTGVVDLRRGHLAVPELVARLLRSTRPHTTDCRCVAGRPAAVPSPGEGPPADG
jgi:hypothetical protein